MLNSNRLCVVHIGFNGFCVFDDFLGISHLIGCTMCNYNIFSCLDRRLIFQHAIFRDVYAVKASTYGAEAPTRY